MVTELGPTQLLKKRRRCIGFASEAARVCTVEHCFVNGKLGLSIPNLAVLASPKHVIPRPLQKQFLDLLGDTTELLLQHTSQWEAADLPSTCDDGSLKQPCVSSCAQSTSYSTYAAQAMNRGANRGQMPGLTHTSP